ncbi:MAG: hypothetical protein KF791_20760 [Verrucomicrobiae bacterium]|nr:hypothetical protein [Verrucomicrobiae bacterium]
MRSINSISNALATTSLSTDLNADFYTGRFGGWSLVPITSTFATSASLVLTSIYAYGNADFTQTSVYSSPLIPNTAQKVSQNEGDWLPGAYMQVRATYWVREWIGLYGSAEWPRNGALRIQGLNYEAEFDFGLTCVVRGGMQFTF